MTPLMSDDLLVSMAQKGDDNAFTELYLRYVPIIKAKSYSFKNLTFDKEDFFQEGSIGFLNAVRLYDCTKGASFNSFAQLCIKSRIVSAYRKYKNDDKLDIIDVDDESITSVADSSDLLDNVIDVERVKTILSVIDKTLSKKELAVFHLYINGHSYQEIANETELSVKSVDNALQRIKKKLRNVV